MQQVPVTMETAQRTPRMKDLGLEEMVREMEAARNLPSTAGGGVKEGEDATEVGQP